VAQSARLKDLKKRIRQIGRLLPLTSPTGAYTDVEYDQTRAFQLLSHAEIEAYLEDSAKDVANFTVSGWINDGEPRSCVAHLLLHETHEELPNQWTSLSIQDRVTKARDRYLTSLTRNNGIKERNVLRILLPLGVHEGDLSATWLANMNSFGTARGMTAHSAKNVQTPPDPVAERQRVAQLIRDLGRVDSLLMSQSRRRQASLVMRWMDQGSIDLGAARRRN